MAEQFYTILTGIGQAKIANSGALGTKLNLVKLRIGDGGGAYYNPVETQTDVKNKVWEGNISSIYVDETNSNWIVIETVVPSSAGGFTIREAGIFDDANNLIAIGKYPETYKPVAAEGSSKDLLIRMILEVSNADSVNLKIDPTIVLATKKDIETLESKLQLNSAQLSDIVYQTAGGTATAITLTIKGTLVNGYPITFIASANNSGAATTINGKKLCKPLTTIAPNLIAGKAYTAWYNSTGNCFFIKASAEGNTIAAHVLAGDTFSNDSDTGLVGTLDLSKLISANIKAGITINGVTGKASVVDTLDANVVAGQILNGQTAYVNGNKVVGNMPNHSGTDSPANSIVGTGTGRIYVRPQAGYYDGSVASYVDDGNFNAANIVSGKSIFGVAGVATASSLLKVTTGKIPANSTINLGFNILLVYYGTTNPATNNETGDIFGFDILIPGIVRISSSSAHVESSGKTHVAQYYAPYVTFNGTSITNSDTSSAYSYYCIGY